MMAEFKILVTEYNGMTFKIEEDLPDIGAYLYIYENMKCIKDYLQETIQDCKQLALDDYNVPFESWREK